MEGQDKEVVSIQKRRRRKQEEPEFHWVPNVLLRLRGRGGLSFLLPQLMARQQRGCCSDFRTSPGALSGHCHGEYHGLTPINSHLHHHACEEGFNSPVQSPLRISSLSGGHLHSRWAEWWPKTGACPTAKTSACG